MVNLIEWHFMIKDNYYPDHFLWLTNYCKSILDVVNSNVYINWKANTYSIIIWYHWKGTEGELIPYGLEPAGYWYATSFWGMEEHVTCFVTWRSTCYVKRIPLVHWFVSSFFNIINYVKKVSTFLIFLKTIT